MPRWKIVVEYDGGPFVGWQRQADGPSIQQALEVAVQRISGREVHVQGSGRTDSGVHALGQVAHFDLDKDITALKMRDALNYHLKPHPVSVLQVEETDEEFHARFSATKRAYLYRILDRRAPAALDAGRVWHVPQRLDNAAMHEAAQHLVGKHDFTSFRAAACQADSPVKTLDKLEVRRAGDEIHITAEARSFLHHQIRNFTGTLKLVGTGKWAPADVKTALEARDRSAAGPTCPPQGLYLTGVWFD